MNTETQLMHFDTARRELELASTIDEVKTIRDQAEAIRQYIRQQKGSLEMQNHAAEIKLRAERRAGEMLKVAELQHGARGLGINQYTEEVESHDVTSPPSLDELGITKMQSHRWQLEAEIPEGRFEEFIAETKAAADEITSREALRLAVKIRQEENLAKIKESPELPIGTYSVLYADPPWQYDNSGLNGSAASHYPTMPTDEMISHLIQRGLIEKLDGDCVIFLWVTNPFLAEAFTLLDAFSFEYKTNMVWVKNKATYGKLGFYVYSQHEHLLIATKGSKLPTGEKPNSLINGEMRDHSRKPEIVYEMIEAMYPGERYLELFARNTHDGWESWGNQL